MRGKSSVGDMMSRMVMLSTAVLLLLLSIAPYGSW
jgi:hypothetical protein